MQPDILDMLKVDVAKAVTAKADTRRQQPQNAAFIDALRAGGFTIGKVHWSYEYGPEGYAEHGNVPPEEKASLEELAELHSVRTADTKAGKTAQYRGRILK